MAARFPSRSGAETGRAIVDLVRSEGVISRVALAARSGLTGASVSRVVKRLLDDGLLIEVGQGDRTGGKRATLLELNTAGRYAVGVSIDEAQLTYVVINLRGEVIGELVTVGIGQSEPTAVVRRLAAEIEDLLKSSGVASSTDVTGLGVAVAGREDVWGAPLGSSRQPTEWEQFALRPALQNQLNRSVTLEHDHVCAALGEFWVGRIPVTTDFVCFYAATGFGGGIVLEGEVYRGVSANAGEVGHMILERNGPPCWCGSHGCLEALAGPRTVIRQALDNPELAARLGLTGDPGRVRGDFAAIATAAIALDPVPLRLVEDSAQYVAAAILSLTNILDLDRVILSGPAFAEAGPIYLHAAQAAVSEHSFMRQSHSVSVGLSQLGMKSAAIGAATVALDDNLLPGRSSQPFGQSRTS